MACGETDLVPYFFQLGDLLIFPSVEGAVLLLSFPVISLPLRNTCDGISLRKNDLQNCMRGDCISNLHTYLNMGELDIFRVVIFGTDDFSMIMKSSLLPGICARNGDGLRIWNVSVY